MNPADIDWQRNHYAMMNHGGRWFVPASKSVWTIDKDLKAYIFTEGNVNHPLNQKIRAVVIAAGYAAIIPANN